MDSVEVVAARPLMIRSHNAARAGVKVDCDALFDVVGGDTSYDVGGIGGRERPSDLGDGEHSPLK